MYQRLSRRQSPHWVWRLQKCQNRLTENINLLQGEKNEILTDERLSQLGMEFNKIDIATGACSSPIAHYFDPNPLVRIGNKINTKSKTTPFFKAAKRIHSAIRPKKQSTIDRLLGDALARELDDNRNFAKIGLKNPSGLKNFR